jgi:hypothetical protein
MSNLQVRTDSAVELISIIQLLAGAEKRFAYFFAHATDYRRLAKKSFSAQRKHKAVRLFAKHAERGLTYIDATELALSLGASPALECRRELMYHVVERFGGPDGVEEFLTALRAFARAANFDAFWQESAPFRKQMVATLERQAKRLPLRQDLEAYSGLPSPTSLTIVASPFASRVDAATLVRPDGITVVLGPLRITDGKPRFNLRLRLGDFWRRLAFEQLRGVTEPHRSAIAKSAALFAPIAGTCESWYECVRMHVSFAVAQRLLLSVNPDLAIEYPIKYAKIGIPYIAPLSTALAKYEQQRKKYPTLVEFYPELVKALAQHAVPRLSFFGSIGDIFTAQDVTLIAPTKRRAWAKKIRDEHWPRADLISDHEAVKEDLAERTLVVLGNAKDNVWLAAHSPRLPLKFVGRGLELSRRRHPFFKVGGSVGLVSVALNPLNKRRGMLWIAGSALGRALGDFPPSADFIVTVGSKRVKTGVYDKTRLWDIQ